MTVLSFLITAKDLNSIETNLSRFFCCVENDSSAVSVVKVTLIGGSGNLVKIRSGKRGFISRKQHFAYREALKVVYISAIFPWRSWNSPIGFPNCFRSCAYGMATSQAACMRPTGPPESTNRSRFKPDMRT